MSGADREAGEDFLGGWLRLLRRRAPWAAAVFLAVFALAVVVLVLARPVYRAEARLRLGEPPPMSGVSPNAGILSFFQLGGDAFSNDLEIFASRTLAEGLVRDLALSVEVDAPRDVHREHLLLDMVLDGETGKETYTVRWVAADRVSIERTEPTDSVVGEFAAGAAARFGGVRVRFRERLPEGPAEIELHMEPFGEALRSTASGLSLTRPRREANVLRVTYSSGDPGLAEAVVREGVEAFLAMRAELMERESGETVDSLRTVVDATGEELAAAEAEAERLQRETGLVAPDAQSEALIERWTAMVGELETARAELATLDAQLARVAAAPDRVAAWTALVAHPRFLDNQTVGELLGRLTDLQGLLTEASAERAPGSRTLVTLERQIAELEGGLMNVAQEFRGALAGQVADLSGRVAVMDAELEGVPARVIELGRRQRTVRLLSELLIISEQRLRQEEIRQALTFSNVQVIDPAAVEYRPIWPRTKVGLVVGFILALGSALLAVVVVERADAAVRTEADMERAGAGPVLAAVAAHGGSAALTPEDALAVKHALGGRSGLLVPVGEGGDVGGVGAALERVGVGTSVSASALPGRGAAVSAVDAQAPVVLVVRLGRVRKRDLARAARNLADAGGAHVGTVALARSAADVAAFWG